VGPAEGGGQGAPRTRAERRRQAQARRNRIILVLGVVVSLAVVIAWFPASDLLHQRQQLAAETSELHQLDAQNHSLRRQAKALETPAAVGRIAQQQYDLVKPGEQAYQVLPPSSSDGEGTLATTAPGSRAGGSATTGGQSGSAGTGTRTGTGGTADGTGGTGAGTATNAGFLGRIVQSLEFWR
jgi:cell division protein FtsB